MLPPHWNEDWAWQSIKTVTLNLNTFGDDNYAKQRCEMVQLRLKENTRDHKITTLCFPKICSPLTTTLDVAWYPHLQGLEFSDLNILKRPPVDSNINILLSADYCFDILSGEVCGPTTTPYADGDVSRVNLLIEKQGYSSVPGFLVESNNETELLKSLRQFWEEESLGIHSKREPDGVSLPDIQFSESECRHKVTLAWKSGYRPQSSGYVMCMNEADFVHVFRTIRNCWKNMIHKLRSKTRCSD